MRWIALVVMAAAMAFVPARAYTPESGIWWNPNEPGTGWQFEVQDDFMAITGYTYDEDGSPLFITAAGRMTSPTRFVGEMVSYANGQCLGCPYSGAPDEFAEGPIVVEFDPNDQSMATLTWGGRSMPIERFYFYLKRPEDPAGVPVEVTKMLGEWSMVIDLLNPDEFFLGDVLVFDNYVFEDGVWFFDGCRPLTMIQNFCSTADAGANPATGFYDPSTGFHQIVVVDYFDQAANADVCALYDVQVGADDFRGGWDGDLEFDNDGGAAFYYCDPVDPTAPYNGEYDFYPIEGWRTASRTAVEGDLGPSAKAGANRPVRSGDRVSKRSDASKQIADAMPAAQRARLAELLRKAEARLRAR